MKVEAARKIDAPIDRVFNFVSNVHEMAKAFPDSVIKIETLSEHDTGQGARFREHRLLGKKEDVIEIETIEFVQNEHVKSVTLTAGSLWYTGFAVEPEGSGTLLTMTMEAQPQNLFARIMNIFLKLGMKKGAAEEIDKLKAHCERPEFLAAATGAR